MNSTDALKAQRERRERLFRRSRPHVRPFDVEKDAWVLWAAYDLGSFPNLPQGMKRDDFMAYVLAFASAKASVLMIEDDTSVAPNKAAFKQKVGPVAMVSIDNYGGWRVEPQFEFFFWATPRMRLAAVVAFLQMVRYAKNIGVCVLRVAEKDVAFCEHVVERYDLLRPAGKIPNAGPHGADHLFYVKGRREKQAAQMKEAA